MNKLGLGLILLIFTLSIGTVTTISAQSDSTYITYLKTANLGDKIIVRWAPGDFKSWKKGLDNGYRLERKTLSRFGTALTPAQVDSSKVVLADSLKVLPDTSWTNIIDTNDFAGVAASAIYGDSLDIISTDSLTLERIYNINSQQENRFSMSLFAADQDFNVAQYMGIAFIDTTTVDDEEYMYRVYIRNLSSGYKEKFNLSIINTLDTLVLPPIPGIEVIPGDSSVVLGWDTKSLESSYNSFYVEKSIDGGQTFFRVNEKPIVGTSVNEYTTVFADTLANNDSTFIYRISGYSPFGILGPPSDTVHVKGVPSPLPAYPSFGDTYESSPGVITLTWNYPSQFLPRIQGFNVLRSGNSEFGFEKINSNLLSSSDTSFIDNTPVSSNYYKIEAIDDNGYTSYSIARLVQLIDSVPPSPPSGVICNADKFGRVTVSWNKNSEPDLSGYRVLSSNVETGEYVMLTPQKIKDTFFTHTIDLNILNEAFYYTVIALDRRDNQSDFADICNLEIPDIIAPTAANFKEATPVANGVFFEWILSSSEDADKYDLERQEVGRRNWTNVTSFLHANPIFKFTDTTASHRKKYAYRIMVYDEAKNGASSPVIYVKPLDNGIRDSIENFTITTLLGDAGVVLNWDYDKSDPELAGFEIYRAINNDPIYSYKYLTVEQAGADWRPYGPNQSFKFGYLDPDIYNLPLYTGGATTISNPPNNVNGNIVVTNPPNPGSPSVFPSNSTIVKYKVIAKFIDGATSPFTDILVVFVN